MRRNPVASPALNLKPKTLMLVPSVAKRGLSDAIRGDRHPQMDYFALQQELNADILDYASLETEGSPAIVKLARRVGRDAALAALGFARRRDYDVIFSNGENVSIPLALMLRRWGQRPLHVFIGHRLSPRKKRPFLKALQSKMDAVFVYASTQEGLCYSGTRLPRRENAPDSLPCRREFLPAPARLIGRAEEPDLQRGIGMARLSYAD